MGPDGDESIESESGRRPINPVVSVIAMQAEAQPLGTLSYASGDSVFCGSGISVQGAAVAYVALVTSSLEETATKVIDFINGKTLSDL